MGLSIIDPTGANTNIEGDYKRLGDTKPGWRVNGDATPHSIANSQGSTGSLNFSASRAAGESDLLVARDIMVEGSLGKVQSLTLQGDNVAVTTDTIFARLNTTRSASTWASNLYAGELPWPKGQTITVAGVTRTISQNFSEIVASDSADGYIYFYAKSQDSLGIFPVVLRYTDNGLFDSAWSPVGGTAPDASGGSHFGFAIDRTNQYIYLTNLTQTTSAVVKKYTMSGTFVSEFRPGTGSGFAVASSASLTVDNSGNVYIAGGPAGNFLQKFNSSGVYVTGIGDNTTSGNYGFSNAPQKLAFDGFNILVSSSSNFRIRAYNTSLVFQHDFAAHLLGIGTAAAGQGITVDRTEGVIYIALKGTNGKNYLASFSDYAKVYVPRKVAVIPFADPGIATDSNGRVFVPHLTYNPTAQPSLQLFFERDGKAKLSVMLHYYLCLVLDAGSFEYYFNATDSLVLYAAWEDNLWEMLKQLGAAKSIQYRAGVTTRDGKYIPTITITPVELSGASPIDQTVAGSIQVGIAMTNAVRSYEIINQNTTLAPFGNTAVVYSSEQAGQNYSIDVNMVSINTISVPHSLTSVSSRIIEAGGWDGALDGGYDVYDTDGLKLPVGRFAQYGGAVQAALVDPHTITLTINGPYSEIPGYNGPFSFEGINGVGRLNITGSGTLVNPQSVTIWTGADEGYVTGETGPRINSPFIENLGQLYDCAAWASLELSGPRLELRFDLGPNQGDLFSLGTRVTYNHQNWRIMNIAQGAGTTSVVAVPHTTAGEKDAMWAGQTVGQYDTFWNEYRVYDSKVRPLWRTR